MTRSVSTGTRGSLAILLVNFFSAHAFEPGLSDTRALENGNARVVFVGDSITGLSRNMQCGFVNVMETALEAVYPECRPRLVALGGSGAGVGNWLGFLEQSREKERYLDVKGVGIKSTLSEPADVVVIMLGMNDVIAPYIGDTPAALDGWQQDYEKLIKQLRARLEPKVVGIASITMQTEDPDSATNRFIASMNERLRVVADRLDCRYLPTGETMWEVLADGRSRDPGFHTTYDMIHPNLAGHLGIAIGMLRGLGETEVATHLAEHDLKKQYDTLLDDEQPTLSYRVTPQDLALSEKRSAFQIRYWWHPASLTDTGRTSPRVRLTAPKGWTVSPAHVDSPSGTFSVRGAVDELQNRLRLDAALGDQVVRREIVIPAPWLATAGFVQNYWQPGWKFHPKEARNKVDAAIEREGDLLGLVSAIEDPRVGWNRYFSSLDVKGGAAPGNVDFAAITQAVIYEAGYGVRWIHSSSKRPVELSMGSIGIGSRIYLTVWVNGRKVYGDQLTSAPKRQAVARANLRVGWNTLVFKSNHLNWEWQQSIDLSPVDDDSLDDLRFSAYPPDHTVVPTIRRRGM